MHASRYGTSTFGTYPKVRFEISVVREIRDTKGKSFSGLAKTIYAGIREISARDSSEFRKLVTFPERNDKLVRSLARSPAPSVRDELFAVNFGQTLSSRGGYHESGGNCSRT